MLDPDNQRVLDLIKAAGRPPITQLDAVQAREVYRAGRAYFQPDPIEVAAIRDIQVAGATGEIPARYYRGLGAPDAQSPVLVFYHGGGYVIGDLDTHDHVCRKLANEAGCVVISVDYRLAPEHKFPAAVDDCAAALRWVVENAAPLGLDPARVAVGGDSAGGNLSANMAHFARDGAVPPICFQLLLYPGTDMSEKQASYHEDFSQFPLSLEACRYFFKHYTNGEQDRADPRAAPLNAPNFKGLAPAFVLTAGHDPIRDEGIEYARKLERNGVRVTAVHMSDQMHGFLTMGRMIRAADTALELAGAALRRGFAG